MSERVMVNVPSDPFEASSYDVTQDRRVKGMIDGFHVALFTEISEEMRVQAIELIAGHLWVAVWPDFKEHGQNPPETLLMTADSQKSAAKSDVEQINE